MKSEIQSLFDYLSFVHERGNMDNENLTTIQSLRKNWIFLSKSEDGELYQTPRGKYLLEKNEDDSIKRLQRINE